jgi:uncharacterized RDD family membrane protein YckC
LALANRGFSGQASDRNISPQPSPVRERCAQPYTDYPMEIIQSNNLTPKKRLTSMLADHFIMCMIATAFAIPFMISTFSTSSFQNLTELTASTYIELIGFALYFNKDCINGQSIAKRLLKLQIIDIKTENVASPLQCFVRNIFCILWPIEVIVTLVNPTRRIGDRVAGTKVIVVNIPKKESLNYIQIALSLILGYGLILLVHVLL